MIVGITGAAGYLGGRLIAYLGAQGWVERIIAFDKAQVEPASKVIAYPFDMTNARDTVTLASILVEHGVTHLVHAAFQLQPTLNDPAGMTLTNVLGSSRVFRAALGHVEHLTFISSVAVYGYGGYTSKLNENAALHPTTDYGRDKRAVEDTLARSPAAPRTAILRFAAIAGLHGAQRSPLRALTAQPFFILSDGGHARTQAVHEDDAAALIAAAVRESANGIFNAAPDDVAAWSDIAQLSRRPVLSLPRVALNGATLLNRTLPALEGFTRDVVDLFSATLTIDNAAIKAALGWQPRYGTCDAFYEMFKASGTSR